MNQYNWAVKIELPDTYTPDASIGLYSNYLGWVESDVSGLSGYVSGVIKREGFGALRESWNSEDGGGLAVVHETKITVNNCGKLIHTINDSTTPIYMLGQPCYIYEIGYNTDTTAVTETIIYHGICEAPSWTETDLIIPLRSATLKRRSNLSTVISEGNFPESESSSRGKMIPITFGNFKNDAKALRTKNLETVLSNSWFVGGLTPAGTKYFPCDSSSVYDGALIEYTFTIASGGTASSWDWEAPSSSTYVQVVDGDQAGAIRKIGTWKLSVYTLHVRFTELFEGALIASGASQSWVKIFRRDGEYELDTWPCEVFQDSAEQQLVNNAEIYTYDTDNQKYVRLPDYGIDVSTDTTDYNSLKIDNRMFEDDLDTMSSYIVLPITTLNVSNDDVLNIWWPGRGHYKYNNCAGLYHDGLLRNGATVEDLGAGNENDKSISTYREFRYSLPVNYNAFGEYHAAYTVVFEATLPPAPENCDFDEVYLFIHGNWEWTNAGTKMHTTQQPELYKWRRFAGDSAYLNGTDPQLTTYNEIGYDDKHIVIDDMPYWYYTNATASDTTYNYNHITARAALERPVWYLTGKSKFKIDGITDKEAYQSIQKIGIVIYRDVVTSDSELEVDSFKFYGLAVAFKKSASIKNEVYTGIRGRIARSVWRAGFEPNVALRLPQRITEHVCRLQNWSETGEAMPAAGWGKAYGTTAKIDDSTSYGGFDHQSLTANLNYYVARQIFDESEAQTDTLLNSLCAENFCVLTHKNYSDTTAAAGKEQLIYLLNDTTATTSITLADIVGDIGEVQEPRPEDVYCEPQVRFAYDSGRGDFSEVISVTNVSAASWVSSYTPGFTSGDGEDFWTRCHALWLKYRHIEPVPSDKQDLTWARDYDTAKIYLDRWLRWMTLKRFSFAVSYSTGRTWGIGQKINLTLPHQLDGDTWECMIDDIEKSKAAGTVSLRVVLLRQVGGSDDITEDYIIQDVYDDAVTEEWTDQVVSAGADEITDRA